MASVEAELGKDQTVITEIISRSKSPALRAEGETVITLQACWVQMPMAQERFTAGTGSVRVVGAVLVPLHLLSSPLSQP